jgi:hypothetical protein
LPHAGSCIAVTTGDLLDYFGEDWAPILAEQAALVPQILRLTASTREGVAVQAVAAIRACSDLWVYFDEADEAAEQKPLDAERPFLEAMARYGGVPVPKKISHRGAVAKSAGHITGQPG